MDNLSAMISFPRFIRDLTMPRASRAAAGGFCYHVLNRGNARAEVFHKHGDYDAFVQIIAEASLRNPMRVLAYCLMPNHFHLALWPAKDGDLSRWMHWLLTTHVRHTSGITIPVDTSGRAGSRPSPSKRMTTSEWYCGTSSGMRFVRL